MKIGLYLRFNIKAFPVGKYEVVFHCLEISISTHMNEFT
jgi:hypothetical protein